MNINTIKEICCGVCGHTILEFSGPSASYEECKRHLPSLPNKSKLGDCENLHIDCAYVWVRNNESEIDRSIRFAQVMFENHGASIKSMRDRLGGSRPSSCAIPRSAK